jgi:hypothetical protein
MVQERLPGEARDLPPDELAAAQAAKKAAIDKKNSEILIASKKIHAMNRAARAAAIRRANGNYTGDGPADLERQADQALQQLSAMRRELDTIKRTPVEDFARGRAQIVEENPFESKQ